MAKVVGREQRYGCRFAGACDCGAELVGAETREDLLSEIAILARNERYGSCNTSA
jgi:hypothetical protein